MQCEAENFKKRKEISNTMKNNPMQHSVKISTKKYRIQTITPHNMQCEACHEALEGGRGGARFR